MSKEECFFSSKCGPRHCDAELEIRRRDHNPEKSRSALFERFVSAAESVTDFMPVYNLLADLEHHTDAPQFDSWQAKYSEETDEKLKTIRQNMETSLKNGGVITRVLQTQFMLLMLMVNYLDTLKKDALTIKADKMVDEEISLPQMSAILTEMMLTDKDGDELKEIMEVMIKWKRK